MASQDDLALLKQMYERGEISDEQYDTLRRHVLWGTPLPDLIEEPGPYADEGPATQTWSPPPGWDRPPAPSWSPPVHPLPDPGPQAYRPEPYRQPYRPEPDHRPSEARPGARDDWAKPAKGKRKRRAPKVAAIATSMVLALALVAAGVWWFAIRESGVPAPDYARAVCSGVRDWQQVVDSRSTALVGSIAQQDDREAVRTAVRTFYTDLASRTDGLRTTIADAGAVDVTGGREYADSLAGVVGDQATALRELAARADRLDTTSVGVFQISLQTLLTGAQTSVGKITAALARPPGGTPTPLRQALSAEPACAPYVG